MFRCWGWEMQPGNWIYQSSQNRPFDSCWRWAADDKLLTGRRNYDGGSFLCSRPLVWGCKLWRKFKNADFFFLLWFEACRQNVRRHRHLWPERFKQLRQDWQKKQRLLKILRLWADFLQISQIYWFTNVINFFWKISAAGSHSVAAVGPEPDSEPDSDANADSDGDPEPELDQFKASGLRTRN